MVLVVERPQLLPHVWLLALTVQPVHMEEVLLVPLVLNVLRGNTVGPVAPDVQRALQANIVGIALLVVHFVLRVTIVVSQVQVAAQPVLLVNTPVPLV